jgi:hypothetical protein
MDGFDRSLPGTGNYESECNMRHESQLRGRANDESVQALHRMAQ